MLSVITKSVEIIIILGKTKFNITSLTFWISCKNSILLALSTEIYKKKPTIFSINKRNLAPNVLIMVVQGAFSEKKQSFE